MSVPRNARVVGLTQNRSERVVVSGADRRAATDTTTRRAATLPSPELSAARTLRAPRSHYHNSVRRGVYKSQGVGCCPEMRKRFGTTP